MARNGSGVYSLPTGQPVVTGTTISSTVFNTLTTDLANALTTSIASDGQTAMSANLPMGSNKVTGLGAATVVGDAIRFEQAGTLALTQGAAASGANSDITSLGNNASTIYTTGGTSTAYTIAPAPAITAYTTGQSFFVNFNAASGASPTLQISGIATPPQLVKENADGTYSNIVLGDVPINHRSRITLIGTTQALVERLGASLNGGQSGAAPVYGIRAWATFNGTTAGTNAPTAGGNVATIQRVAAGTYNVTFTTPMPTAFYSVSVVSRNNPSATIAYAVGAVPTAGGFQLLVFTATPAVADSDIVMISVVC